MGITRQARSIQKIMLKSARARRANRGLHKSFSLPNFMNRSAVFFISEHCDRMAEPYLTISQNSPIVWMFLDYEGVENHYLITRIFCQDKLCSHRRGGAARKMANDSAH